MSPSAPSHVFTPEWTAEQRRKYGRSPGYARPPLYDFWTADEFSADRDTIERWVDLLPPEARKRVIPKLRTSEQFTQVYNELAVGESLRQMGHAAEYEVEIDGLTPDWTVRPRGDDPGFILEVVASEAPEERSRHDERWDAFRRRLEVVRADAILSVQPPLYDGGETPVPPPEGPRQKQIVRYVEQWLKSDPPAGEGYAIDGIVIRFLGWRAGGGGVASGMLCLPFWVDGGPLRDAIKEKASKYRSISETTRLPFVVCVVPTFGSGRGLQEVQTAALGTEQCRLVQAQEGPPRQENYRDNNGLFAKYPTLSAVTMATLQGPTVTHMVLHNPSAVFPLGKKAFPSESTVAANA
jgi:hypothetical protein